jgi:hypothetical protein
MHVRTDFPETDAAQRQRVLSGGLEKPWTRLDPELPVLGEDWLAA